MPLNCLRKIKWKRFQIEWQVYENLGASPYFSSCYGFHDNYLILSFEEGTTLYDCLLQGISIPKQAMEDVEQAREYVRQKELNA